MFLQRRDEYLARQFQEFIVKAALDGHRPFHERGDFIEQGIIEHGPTTQTCGSRFDLLADTFATFTKMRDDMTRLA